MREYMTNEYKKNLEGKAFTSSDGELKQYNGLKVIEVVRELTEKDYDRERIDDTDKNENGEARYLINTMYEVRLENNEVITVYEDEINPDYAGSWVVVERMNFAAEDIITATRKISNTVTDDCTWSGAVLLACELLGCSEETLMAALNEDNNK